MMTGWQALAIIGVVTLSLGGVVGVVIWVLDRSHARAAWVWQAAGKWVVHEREVSRAQLAEAHGHLVDVVKNTQPRDRTDEVQTMKDIEGRMRALMNHMHLELGRPEAVDHNAETQKTTPDGPGVVIP